MEWDEDTCLKRERTEGKCCLSGFGDACEAAGRRFFDLAGFETAYADINTSDSTVWKEYFDRLKVWIEAAAGDSGDFFTDTAGFFG